MAICITHDGQINAAEAELMRAVAETLDCPMPPLLGEANTELAASAQSERPI